MQWDSTATGGFTSGEPWLPAVDPQERSVAAQHEDPDSLLHLYRRLLGLRRGLGGGFRLLDSAPGLVAFERGDHVVAVNTTGEQQPTPATGDLVLATSADVLADRRLAPHAATIVRKPG
jgi:glycosidase